MAALSVLVDVRYALRQLRGVNITEWRGGAVGAYCSVKDRVERAIDALERVEEALTRPEEDEEDEAQEKDELTARMPAGWDHV